MLPNGKPIILALLAAYCALAAPVKAQPDQFHAVLDALKAQMKAEYNIDASLAVDEVEAFLWAKGVLNNEIYAKLNQEILVSKRSHFFVLPLALQLEILNFWRYCI